MPLYNIHIRYTMHVTYMSHFYIYTMIVLMVKTEMRCMLANCQRVVISEDYKVGGNKEDFLHFTLWALYYLR